MGSEHVGGGQEAVKDPDYAITFADEDESTLDREGKAMVVLRIPSGRGLEAWSKLFNRFDPKTPVKAQMAMMAVMSPKVKDVRDLSNAVED